MVVVCVYVFKGRHETFPEWLLPSLPQAGSERLGVLGLGNESSLCQAQCLALIP